MKVRKMERFIYIVVNCGNIKNIQDENPVLIDNLFIIKVYYPNLKH